MNDKLTISVRGVALEVPTFVQKDRGARTWARMLLGAAFDPPRRQLNTLLDDVSFDVKEGDRLAILGRNGAGKSTLLRVLNRVFVPTRGTVEVHGSTQALLNMSLGFNGEATVRENIFLRGTAMGLRSAELRDMIEPIMEFAGLQEKLNHRLRTLSTGQKMRLGFAISTAVQHDIILMDEWVGTGDSEFMRKAKERMLGRMSGSKTVVLASHSLGLLRDVCNRAIVMERGRLVFSGSIVDGLKKYQELMARPPETPGIGFDDSDPAREGVVAGAVDQLSINNGSLHLAGWMLKGFSDRVGLLAVEINGHRTIVSDFKRTSRRDVQAHFGLPFEDCGFSVDIEMPPGFSPEILKSGLLVTGGDGESEMGGAFRLAPAVLALLERSAAP